MRSLCPDAFPRLPSGVALGRAAALALVLAQFALGVQDAESNVSGPKTFKVKRETRKDSQFCAHDEAWVDVPNQAVDPDLDLEIVPLKSKDVPSLDHGMSNVTRGPRRGYRFLPHGTKFKKNVRVCLPYDRSLIPPGHSEEDVRTFYFDEKAGLWKRLECLSVDTRTGCVVSATDHFTDFINATVTVPDHPGLVSFDPNQFTDIAAADPASEMALIEPPRPNNQGVARLSYPFLTPPARVRSDFKLAATYSSGTVNGWLGLGWSLPARAVTIDTQWGVPRYDPALETESYILENEALTPLAHRGPPQPRAPEKPFRHRVEGAFSRIVRHGGAPTDYCWEVTDKNGTRRLYGGDSATNLAAPDATLADERGNVFLWALREIRDLNGNFIRFHYARVVDAGLAGGTVQGQDLYLQQITYTGHGSLPGPYAVTFIRDRELGEPRRPDVMVDCRGGFKRVTADLLRRMDVSLNGQLIRRYEFRYTEGAFRKSLLSAILQFGEDGTTEFHRHAFEYYDEARTAEGTYRGFDAPAAWNPGNDDVTAGLLGRGRSSAISGAITKTVGGHLYVGFNPNRPTKNGSAGFKVGHQRHRSDGVLTLADVNGDNLPDKVFKSGGHFKFRANLSGPAGSPTFGPEQPLPTLPAISKDVATTTSLGVEAYLFGNVFVNRANTFSTGSAYFVDANGDSIADVVRDGTVYFGYLDGQGNPAWSPDSSVTPVPVGAGAVDATELLEDYEAVFQEQIDTYPLADTLRRWVAPFAGTVKITAPVRLLQDTSPERAEYLTADGVRVAVQHNGGELCSASIGPDDYAEKTPAGLETVPVQKGDRIYFRVQSVFDGAFDQVSWDPEIQYLNVNPVLDVNALNVYRYKASEDFTFAGRPGIRVEMPVQGTVRLTGDLKKKGTTSDDVTLVVTKNGAEVLRRTLTWNETGTIGVNQDFLVAPQDQVQLRVKVDSNVDLGQVEWVPSLFYVDAPGVGQITDDQGNFLLQLFPPYDIDFYPVNDLVVPQEAWTATQTGTLTVVPEVGVAPNAGNVTGEVFVTVKKERELVGKKRIGFGAGENPDPTFTVEVTQGDKLTFDYSSYDPQLKDKLVNKTVRVAYGNPDTVPTIAVPSGFHSGALQDHHLFPGAYQGWAAAGYNGNRERAQRAVEEGLLVFNEHDYEGEDTHKKVKAYVYNPFPSAGHWRGPDELTWVRGDRMSSSRLGLDFIEVPRASQFAGLRAVSRLSRTTQTAVGLALGSLSPGESHGLVDYMDMNGDRFPDVVGNGRIQYTSATGTLEPAGRAIPGLGRVRKDETKARNFGIGGGPAASNPDSQGREQNGTGAAKQSETGSQMVALGIGGSLTEGESHMRDELLDVNGDGLPDRVSSNGSRLNVAFNLGYGFAPAEPWGDSAVNEGTSKGLSIGGSLGFNGGIYDFAGGLSLSKNEGESQQALGDINGDGLLDRIRPTGHRFSVAFNTGAGFAPEVEWPGALAKEMTRSGTVSLGGGVYFTIGIGPLCIGACYVIINPGADASQSMARQEVTLRDVDGDGYDDHLLSEEDHRLTVGRNPTGRTNLLRVVRRPLGATVTLEYARAGNTPDMPQTRWVLTKTAVFDGHPGDGVDTMVATYRYEGGKYDRLERDFLGFSRVVEEHRDASQGESLYRTVTYDYLNDSFYLKGLLARVRKADAAGRPFLEVEHAYLLRDVATGNAPGDPRSTVASEFPMLTGVDTRFFEGQPAPGKTTSTTLEYDALGNIVRYFDAGDAGAGDDVEARVTYTGFQASYVVGTPRTIEVLGNGSLLRRREATVDASTGNVTQVRQYLEDGTAAATELDYHANGNLRGSVRPPNLRGQRYALTFEYDSVASTYAVRTSDSFGYVSESEYNLKYGKPALVTDANGNRIRFGFDSFGRVLTVTGPNEAAGPAPTVVFEYHPGAAIPWALTRRLDRFRDPGDPIESAVFVDGLRRQVQTKADATVRREAGGPPEDVMVVSGRQVFDFVGRIVEQRYPTAEPVGQAGVFSPAADSVAPSRMLHDVLDRPVRGTFPDATSSETEYGFGQDRDGLDRFLTTSTDAQGNRFLTYRSVRQLITAVRESNRGGAETVWTSYRYDPLHQITDVTDDRGNVTRMRYDLLGRRLSVDSPDAGLAEFGYDLAGSVVRKVTPVLRARGKFIGYEHDFERLGRILYPDFPGNNVTYEYGPPGAPANRAGRIQKIVDQSGTLTRSYDAIGQIAEETRIVPIDVPGGDVALRTFTTRFTFDSFQRLQHVTYPDGEVLTYGYDAGGLPRSAKGIKEGRERTYLARLEYDKFGKRAFLELGNGLRTTYAYDPAHLRLVSLGSDLANQTPFQSLRYGYDKVGNILSIQNDVPVVPGALGGPFNASFVYDDLYRLTRAEAAFQGDLNGLRESSYTLDMDYDTIHNVRRKHQAHRVNGKPGKPTSYNWTYTFGGAQPHAPTKIGGRDFTYDANGNQTGFSGPEEGNTPGPNNGQVRRTVVWDEEGRLQSVTDQKNGGGGGSVGVGCLYDHQGRRAVKRASGHETAYVNQFLAVQNRNRGALWSKHVFVGGTRLASTVFSAALDRNDVARQDGFAFFYHSDHLGSSTFISDRDGKLRQHTQYFPSGETWVRQRLDEHDDVQDLAHAFTGKELDPESQLYYYGLRYYDPRTSLWQSPDPMLSSYLPASRPGSDLPAGGVFNSANLNLYGYSGQNPLRFVDKNGGFFLVDDFIVGFVQALFEFKNPFKEGVARWNNAAAIWSRSPLSGAMVKLDVFQFFGLLVANWEGRLGEFDSKDLDRILTANYMADSYPSKYGDEPKKVVSRMVTGKEPDLLNSVLENALDFAVEQGIRAIVSWAVTGDPLSALREQGTVAAFQYGSVVEAFAIKALGVIFSQQRVSFELTHDRPGPGYARDSLRFALGQYLKQAYGIGLGPVPWPFP